MTEQTQGVIPHLVVEDAAAALEFYKQALGARETMRVPAEDGKRLLHAELQVNGARIYLRDDFPDFREQCGANHVQPPKQMGGTSVTLHLDVEDCDAAVKRAETAGATVTMPPEDAFWGARYAQVVDPYGHAWSFAHPLPGAPG
ncbi:MAG: VOC family protein [Kiloniellales bacterium]